MDNIHDKFVRESFSDPHRAASSLRKLLPDELVAAVDFDTLKVLNESYIDEELKEYFSDLVFELSTKEKPENKADIGMLFEHKSVPDKLVLIQVGYYMFAHYFKSLHQGKKLKPIIPIIYYQGKKQWTAPQIWELFDSYPQSLQAYVPTLNHIFVALHSLSNELLMSIQNTMMAVAMTAQKWRHDPVRLVEDIQMILSLFQDEKYDRNFLKMTFV